MNAHDRERLASKLSRAEAGLAPEDEYLGQAQNTAKLRDDPEYVERWLKHEETLKVPMLDEPCDQPAGCASYDWRGDCRRCGFPEFCHGY